MEYSIVEYREWNVVSVSYALTILARSRPIDRAGRNPDDWPVTRRSVACTQTMAAHLVNLPSTYTSGRAVLDGPFSKDLHHRDNWHLDGM